MKGANGGTAVNEDTQTEVEIVLDVIENLIHNYKVEERAKGTPNLQLTMPERKVPVIGSTLQERITNWWQHARQHSESSFDFDW